MLFNLFNLECQITALNVAARGVEAEFKKEGIRFEVEAEIAGFTIYKIPLNRRPDALHSVKFVYENLILKNNA